MIEPGARPEGKPECVSEREPMRGSIRGWFAQKPVWSSNPSRSNDHCGREATGFWINEFGSIDREAWHSLWPMKRVGVVAVEKIFGTPQESSEVALTRCGGGRVFHVEHPQVLTRRVLAECMRGELPEDSGSVKQNLRRCDPYDCENFAGTTLCN